MHRVMKRPFLPSEPASTNPSANLTDITLMCLKAVNGQTNGRSLRAAAAGLPTGDQRPSYESAPGAVGVFAWSMWQHAKLTLNFGRASFGALMVACFLLLVHF